MQLCPQCGSGVNAEGLCANCHPAETPTLGMTMATVAFVTPNAQASEPDDDSFGNYTVLRVLGEGGMGTVFKAEQTAPIRRIVALKVVKLGMDTNHVLARFAYERQTLAMMDHPNIARVYDASATAKGRPFFVMEYVDGVPITKYCDDHRLTTGERLALFLPICEAVQHAHQKGIIHRDLKPTNVLVMDVDGKPIAKVIDFGIAKAVDQSGGDEMLTQLGQFVGTPEYMSPEQADPMNQTVDATSDVYSLGVMLYELLVGAVPFDSTAMRKGGLVELMRVIREDEAPTLHAKLTGLGHTAGEIAELRGMGLMALRKELAGDLNWIVMKAVEKSRERRYATAADLAADIRRHLENRPVMASPPSQWYRVRKFVRRNRLPVLAATAAAAALMVGLAAAIWQAGIARRERAVAVQQRSVAEARGREAALQAENARRQQAAAEHQSAIAASRLEDVSALANSMLFDVGDRVRELPGSMPAREVLMQRGLDYLNRMSAETPDSTRLREQLGAAYLKMGELQWDPDGSSLRDLTGARESYAHSAALLEAQLQDSPRDSDLRHRLTLAYLRHAQLLDSDREQQAGYAQALESARKLAAEEPANAQAKDDLAEVYLAKQEFARAVELREQIAAGSPKSAQARWKLYSAQTRLAFSLQQKDDERALQLLNGVVAGLEALHREEPANVRYERDRGVALQYLGLEFMYRNRFDDGLARAREAVDIQTRLAAADITNAGLQLDLNQAQALLGRLLVNLGQNTAGMEQVNKALAAQEEQAAAHPENPVFTQSAARLENLMAALSGQSSDAAAIIAHRQAAVALYRKLVRDHPGKELYVQDLAGQLVALADAQSFTGNRAAAMENYREAIQEADHLGASGHITDEDWTARGDAHAGAARGAAGMNRTDEAIGEDRQAIADYLRVSAGNGNSDAAERTLSLTWSHLATAYTNRGDHESAVEAARKALPYAEQKYAADPHEFTSASYLVNALDSLRSTYTNAADYDHAVEAARREVEIGEKLTALLPGDLNRVAMLALAHTTLGSALRSAGHRDESLASYRRTAAVLDGNPIENISAGPIKLRWAGFYRAGVRGLILWEEQQEALPVCRRLIAAMEALHQAAPNNNAYRTELVADYRAEEGAFLNSGMLAEGLEVSQKILRTEGENQRQDAAFFLNQGLTQAKIGSVESQLGKAEAAQASWRKALDLFEKSRADAAKTHAERGDDRTALQNLANAERRIAFLHDLLGDPEEALRRMKDAIVHMAALADSDAGSREWAHLLRDYRAEAVRLEWLVAGGKGDFTSRRLDLARGWEQYSVQLTDIASPMPARLMAARQSVDLVRQSGDARPASQVDLAEAVGQLGYFQLVTARFTEGAARTNALHEAAQAFAEERRILSGLKQAGSMPDENRTTLIDAGNYASTVAARLAALNLAER